MLFGYYYNLISFEAKSIEDLPIELHDIFSGSMAAQQQSVPASPIGNIIALNFTENEITFQKQFGFGRAALMRLPYLRYAYDNFVNDYVPAGPNVLLMSGTGFIPGSSQYHISDDVDYILETDENKRKAISNTKIFDASTDNIRISGGGSNEKKLISIDEMIEKNKDGLWELRQEGNVLVVTNSYEQSDATYRKYMECELRNYADGMAKKVYRIVSNDILKNGVSDASQMVSRKDIQTIGKNIKNNEVGIITFAPASVIARGYNILDDYGNALFNVLVFLVRPMPDNSDMSTWTQQINGYIMSHYQHKTGNILERSQKIHKKAFSLRNKLIAQNLEGFNLADLTRNQQWNVICNMIVLIQQVFGRMCRFSDNPKQLYIYFMDNAFTGAKGKKRLFNTLKMIRKYLSGITSNPKYSTVAESLYGPLNEAFEKCFLNDINK